MTGSGRIISVISVTGCFQCVITDTQRETMCGF